jgi:DNA-binding IclR family transcriptional regulator
MQGNRNPVRRSLQVLRYLMNVPDQQIGVRALAATFKEPPSTMHRVLSALVEEGFVERDADTGLYSLGLEMVRLAHTAVERVPAQKIAVPHLRRLAEETGETALLGLYDRTRQEVMFTAAVESPQPLRYVNLMRTWLPLHAGATGLAILAFLPEPERAAFIKSRKFNAITDRTVTDRRKLALAVDRIRRNGYACTQGQRTPGAVGIAAPIFGPSGEVIGDVIITLPEQRFERGQERKFAEHVMQCARRVTHELGGPSPSEIEEDASPRAPSKRAAKRRPGARAELRADGPRFE